MINQSLLHIKKLIPIKTIILRSFPNERIVNLIKLSFFHTKFNSQSTNFYNCLMSGLNLSVYFSSSFKILFNVRISKPLTINSKYKLYKIYKI